MFKSVTPPITGWLEVDVDKPTLEYLNERIDAAHSEIFYEDVKNRLAGHISSSLSLVDVDNKFHNNFLIECANEYDKAFPHAHRIVNHTNTSRNLVLNGFWVNYQNKHEFNPPHNHGGVFSFVIWIKIPTYHKDQSNLEFLKGQGHSVASSFEMSYTDTTGRTCPYIYEMNPDMEGKMLFFPSALKHSVYPFYECDDTRISISGNLYYA
tara:strand:- start:458 stop:1084 length:627 start_codon:yes stop_codon:yes gene_type:complete